MSVFPAQLAECRTLAWPKFESNKAHYTGCLKFAYVWFSSISLAESRKLAWLNFYRNRAHYTGCLEFAYVCVSNTRLTECHLDTGSNFSNHNWRIRGCLDSDDLSVFGSSLTIMACVFLLPHFLPHVTPLSSPWFVLPNNVCWGGYIYIYMFKL